MQLQTFADASPTSPGSLASETRGLPRREPDEVIASVLRRFTPESIVMTTSFGMEGCALVEYLHRLGLGLRVVYIDTGFLFRETLELRDRMIRRYPDFTFERVAPDLTPEEQAHTLGPALWSRDPDRCCQIRKVEPLAKVLHGAQAWVTALRRGQSSTRASLRHIEWDWQSHTLKISPLADWTREQVWAYVKAHNVPYNPLHEQGFPSIGCTHCTRPVAGARPDEYSRDGRWQGTGKTECGLHHPGA